MSLIALRIKMNNLLPTEAVQVKDGKLVTTSLVVAKVFGKEHKNVLRDVEALDCSDKFRKLNFEPTFRNVPGPNNSIRQERYFEVTRDGFTFLARAIVAKNLRNQLNTWIKLYDY